MYIGVDYYPEHWPVTRWATDARLMREAGFNVVRLAEFAWSRLEPAEGQFDFAWLDDALAILAAHGISAVLGTPTAVMPAWVAHKYPETLATQKDGNRQVWGQEVYHYFTGPRWWCEGELLLPGCCCGRGLLLRRREGRLLNPGPLPKRVQDVLHVSETRRALRMNEMRPSATARVVRPSDGPSAVVGYSRAGERLPEGCQPRAVRQVGLRRRSGAVDDRVFHSSTPEMRSNNNEGSMFGLFYAIGFRLRIIKPMRCRSSY